MTPRQVKSEFGQIIVESYKLSEIIVIGRLTSTLEDLYMVYKELGISDDS